MNNKNRPNENWWRNVKAIDWENEVNYRKKQGDSDYKKMEDYLLDYFKKFQNAKILDYGCGFGRNTINLINNTQNEMFAVDINESMIESVSNKIKDKIYSAAHFKVLDNGKIPFPDNFFDYTFTNEVLIHVHPDDLFNVLKEILRVTKNKILLLENILVYESAQTNLAHNGCWLHAIQKIITEQFHYPVCVSTGCIERQNSYEIDKTSNSEYVCLKIDKKIINDLDTIEKIAIKNLISIIKKENLDNIKWISKKDKLINKQIKKIQQYKDKNIKLSNKESESTNELIKIHNSRLWKIYLLYRVLLNRINIKKYSSKEISTIEYVDGNFKKNHVLGICHPDWQGVKNATLNQCSQIIIINTFNKQTINKIITFIKKNNFSKIAINAIPNNTGDFIHKVSQKLPTVKIYLIWHGSFTQQTIEDHIDRIDGIYPYFKKIYKFGFVKNNTAEVFQKLGLKAEFLPNRIPFFENSFLWKKVKQEKIKIGILSRFLWHKNNVNEVIAASLVKKSEIHTLFFPKIKYLSKLLSQKIRQHETLEHTEYQKLLSEMDINLYISLTECYPMAFFESLITGTPCLVGKTSEFILDEYTELKNFLVVQNPEDIFEIHNKIKNIIKNYSHVQKLCHSFISKSDENNSKLILNFFKS